MSKLVARVGDTTSHEGQYNGTIVSGSPTFTLMGVPVARVGDTVMCSKHGKQTIVSGSPTHTDNDTPIAHVGSKVSCGATVVTGYADFTVGD